MLSLLTLLLPSRATVEEIAFHRDLVLSRYRDYYGSLRATGYRDRETLRHLKRMTAYSMSMLRWRESQVWHSIRRFQHLVWGLPHVIPLDKIEKILRMP